MAIVNNPIAFYAGNHVQLPFSITEQDGSPTPLSGASATFKLVALEDGLDEPAAGATPALTLSSPDDISFNTVDGVATVQIDPTDTEDLSGRFYYELELTTGGATVVVATGVAQIRVNV